MAKTLPNSNLPLTPPPNPGPPHIDNRSKSTLIICVTCILAIILIGVFFVIISIIKKIDPSTFLHLITSRYSMGVLTGFSAGIAFMLTVGKLKKWIKEIYFN